MLTLVVTNLILIRKNIWFLTCFIRFEELFSFSFYTLDFRDGSKTNVDLATSLSDGKYKLRSYWFIKNAQPIDIALVCVIPPFFHIFIQQISYLVTYDVRSNENKICFA